jgi:hypothetical protein
MCVFKSLTGYTNYGGYENQNAHFLIIMKSKRMKSISNPASGGKIAFETYN